MNKDIFDYGYVGNEVIEISVDEYYLLKIVVEQFLQTTMTGEYPKKYDFINTKNGKEVKNPQEKDLETGLVKKVFSKNKTFHPENLLESFDATKLTKELIDAQIVLTDIHLRNVEKGVAKTKEQLEEFRNKLKTEKIA